MAIKRRDFVKLVGGLALLVIAAKLLVPEQEDEEGVKSAAHLWAAAQIVACECVVIAETKDHLDWQLIGEMAKKLTGAQGAALKQAHEEVEDQEEPR